jgi:pimeloyl-ACP methyl ester carboxylesterase
MNEHVHFRSYTRRDALGLGTGTLAALLSTALVGCVAPHDPALDESQPAEQAQKETQSKDLSAIAYDERTVPLTYDDIALNLVRMQVADQNPERSILLLHGVTYSSHEFDIDYKDYSLARFLARQGYTVWRLDIAGFGESDDVWDGYLPNSDYAAENAAAAAELIIQTERCKSVDVLGWSWGTVVASRMAAAYPDFVDKLVLYAPILRGLGEEDYIDAFHSNTWEHAASDFQLADDDTFDDKITDPVLRELFCSSCWHYDGDSSPNGGRLDLSVDESVELIDLDAIQAPTLVICGDADPYLDLDAVNDSIDSLPKGSAVEVIPGGAHVVMYEKPYYHDFQQRLAAFLG